MEANQTRENQKWKTARCIERSRYGVAYLVLVSRGHIKMGPRKCIGSQLKRYAQLVGFLSHFSRRNHMCSAIICYVGWVGHDNLRVCPWLSHNPFFLASSWSIFSDRIRKEGKRNSAGLFSCSFPIHVFESRLIFTATPDGRGTRLETIVCCFVNPHLSIWARLLHWINFLQGSRDRKQHFLWTALSAIFSFYGPLNSKSKSEKGAYILKSFKPVWNAF